MVAAVTDLYTRRETETEAAETAATVRLREGGSVAVAGRERRRGWTIAIAATVALAGAAAVVIARHDPEDARVSSAPDAPPSETTTTTTMTSDAGPEAGIAAGPEAGRDAGIAAGTEAGPDAGIAAAPAVRPAGPARPRPTPPAAKPGYYSVDSNPYATIFIDGKRFDQTPLFRVELAAGRHQIRAVLKDGRERSFTIKIDPGKDITSNTLAW